jgi:hypothetical protein
MTSTTDQSTGTHPIVAFGVRVHEVLDRLASAPVWAMSVPEQRAALVALGRAEARLVDLRLRVLAQADRDDIAADSAASGTAAWVAQHTRQGRGAADADLRLAVSLESGHPCTRAAFGCGAGGPGPGSGDRGGCGRAARHRLGRRP